MRITTASAAILFLLIVGFAQQGCAGHPTRQDTIKTMIVAMDATRDGFAAWDRTTQEQIATTALSRQEALDKLDKHDELVRKVAGAITVAYRALAVAASQDDESTLTVAKNAAAKVLLEIAAAQESH